MKNHSGSRWYNILVFASVWLLFTLTMAVKGQTLKAGGFVTAGFRLTITGNPGIFLVSGSTNLTRWDPLAMVTNLSASAQFTDTAALNMPTRFYTAGSNVVGYYQLRILDSRYRLIANQLNNADNAIARLMPNVEYGTMLQKFDGSWTAYIFEDLGGWLPDGGTALIPGEGFFFKSPFVASFPVTLTFIGEVPQGALTNTLPIGAYAVRSSMVPQAGGATTVLGIPAEDGDQLQVYRNGSYLAFTYDALEPGWLPTESFIEIGEAFFYRKAPTATSSQWIRDFRVESAAYDSACQSGAQEHARH